MRTLTTPIGPYWFDDSSPSDTRVGLPDVTVVESLGPNSTYSWSLDREEALFEAARAIGVSLELQVPGGWKISPGAAAARLFDAVTTAAGKMPRTDRLTPPRG